MENSPRHFGNTAGKVRGSSKKRKSAQKKVANVHLPHHTKGVEDHTKIELHSPTSISMKNSLFIKTANNSFDAYYNIMRKRTKSHANVTGVFNMSTI